ncbi:MAG: hypothetical protein Kow0075_04600 [Salibacteraceae bacterium]
MKHVVTSLMLSAGLLGITTAGQAQDLPKPSPFASVTQRVGLTDITIEYSRPGVKDRVIWGELVPYNEMWRAGANKATQFETTDAIRVAGEELAAGKYGLFFIPREGDKWTLILNKETELWGTTGYDSGKDALRVEVEAMPSECFTERLEYDFELVDMSNATLVMKWELMKVVIPIEADPMDKAMRNIKTALAEAKPEDKWRIYRNAASFAEDVHMTEEGLNWIRESVKLKESWYSYWVYASLLAQAGKVDEAIEKANKAIEIGQAEASKNNSEFSYAEDIRKDIDTWKSQVK